MRRAGRTTARTAGAPGLGRGRRRTRSDEAVVVTQNWDEIRRLMWNYVGIVRTDQAARRARAAASRSSRRRSASTTGTSSSRATSLELRNIACVAELIVELRARRRKESRGLHYTIDYPEPDPAWRRDTVVHRQVAEADDS